MQSANSNKDENSAGGKEKDNTLLEGSTFSMKTDRNTSAAKKNSYDAFDAITKAVVKHSWKKYPHTNGRGLHEFLTVRRRSAHDLLILCSTEDKNVYGLKNCKCSFHLHAKAQNSNSLSVSNNDDIFNDESLDIGDDGAEDKKGSRVAAAKIRKVCLEHTCITGEVPSSGNSNASSKGFSVPTPPPMVLTPTFPFQNMYKLVCGLLYRPDCVAFREPVDWKYLGLVDYPDIVKHPMDLGTVMKKVESEQYSSNEEIASDVRLVWSNCKLYNRDGSEFYFLADKFSKDFESAYTALQKFEESQRDPSRIPSVQEKMQLTYDVFRLSNAEMTVLLEMVQKECSAAIAHAIHAEEVMLNVDGLSPHCFHSVNEFVQSALLAQSSKTISSKSKKRGLPLLPVPRQTTQHCKTSHTTTTATTATSNNNNACSSSSTNNTATSIVESKVEDEEEYEFVG